MNGSDYPSVAAQAPDPGAAVPDQASVPSLPPGAQRFRTCRWRQAAEDSVPDHCTHRDVIPMAGTAGFDPEAWCVECSLYKVRRMPRKRPPQAPTERNYY